MRTPSYADRGRARAQARRRDGIRADATGYPGISRDPTSNFWYGDPSGAANDSGVVVTADTALNASAVFRATAIVANSVAQLPLRLFRVNGKTKTPVLSHRVLDVLEGRPNPRHTPFDLKQLLMGWTCLRGNGIAEIVASRENGFLDHLEPLLPARIGKVDLLPNGKLRYLYNPPNGPQRTLDSDQVLHVRGLSTDGIMGLSIVGAMRQAVGLSLATERMAAQQFGRAPRPAGVLESPKSYKDESIPKRIAESFRAAHSGANANGVAFLEEGTTYKSIGMNNDDAQFLESRAFELVEVSRFSGVDPVLLFAEKGSAAIEQIVLAFMKFGLVPWLCAFEGAVKRDLILEPDIFCELDASELLRGDTAAQTAYWTAATARRAWATPNEARLDQGLPRITDDPEMDKVHEGLGATNGAQVPDPASTGSEGGSTPKTPSGDALNGKSRLPALSE